MLRAIQSVSRLRGKFFFTQHICLCYRTACVNESNEGFLESVLPPLLSCALTFLACSDVMKLGYSKPWPEAMAMITGQSKMTAQPLMQYFEPLIKWLEEENNKNNEVSGWPDYNWRPLGMINAYTF